MTRISTLFVSLLFFWPANRAHALDYVTMRRDGAELRLSGKITIEARDGGVMLMDDQGKLWTIQKEEQTARSQDDRPFRRLKGRELADAVLKDLPDGFSVHATAHYVICYNTSITYAEWTGAMLERLHKAFANFWSRKGFELHEADAPLVVLVFADKESYRRYAVNELGDSVDSIIAYYNLKTNRIAMYDLTGVQADRAARPNSGRRNSAEITAMLARPAAASLVATIVHEATHQIAFNCGLQTRMADVPVWVSEGIAMYFETPDVSGRSWRGVGAINRGRLDQFRHFTSTRPPDSLRTLLADDVRLQKPDHVLDAYAEAWALTYYLLKQRPAEFVAYMKLQAKKQPMLKDTPEERVQQFELHFGDLKRLDGDFLRQVSHVR